jgi:hypothetical protein
VLRHTPQQHADKPDKRLNTHKHTPKNKTQHQKLKTAASAHLYAADPDLDEYDGPDDAGYWRREVACQGDFAARYLERTPVRFGES